MEKNVTKGIRFTEKEILLINNNLKKYNKEMGLDIKFSEYVRMLILRKIIT